MAKWTRKLKKHLRSGVVRKEDDTYVGQTDRGQEVVLGFEGDEARVVNLLGPRGTVSDSMATLLESPEISVAVPSHTPPPTEIPITGPGKRWFPRTVPPSKRRYYNPGKMRFRRGQLPKDEIPELIVPDDDSRRPSVTRSLPGGGGYSTTDLVSPDDQRFGPFPVHVISPTPMPMPGTPPPGKATKQIMEAIVGSRPEAGWMDLNDDGVVNIFDAITSAQRDANLAESPMKPLPILPKDVERESYLVGDVSPRPDLGRLPRR